MNDLTQQLEQLNRAVPDAPGFAASVMQRIAQEPAPQAPSYLPRRRAGGARWFIGAALAACAITGAAAGMWAITPEPIAFAQVAEAMQRARTLSFTGISDEQHGRYTDHVFAESGVGTRTESGKGVTYVYDARSGDFLAVDKRFRQAVKSHPGRNDSDPATWLLNLTADRGAKAVGHRDINGRRTDGLRLTTKMPPVNFDVEVTLWVDPKTQLPVEAEIVPINAPGGGAVPLKWTLRDIRFDEPLDDTLFDTEKSVPPGFQRTVIPPTTRPAVEATRRKAA